MGLRMVEVKVLFVCMGNICRSPTAEGVFRHLVAEKELSAQVTIDLAGTHSYHVGSVPDKRSQQAALQRGIDLSGQCARQLQPQDLLEFDYVLAMDKSNLQGIQRLRTHQHTAQIGLFLNYAAELPANSEVPDPYYGAGDGFERVLDMIEQASIGLLNHILQHDISS